jgi:hypothetical protein
MSRQPVVGQHAAKKSGRTENIVTGIAGAAAVGIAFALDNRGLPQKWHAAIMWTFTAFLLYILLSRHGRFVGVRVDYAHRKLSRDGWRRWRFWVISIIVMALHLLFIYLLFAVVLARVRVLGMIYVYPLALAEGVVLTGLVARIERATTPWLHNKSSAESSSSS